MVDCVLCASAHAAVDAATAVHAMQMASDSPGPSAATDSPGDGTTSPGSPLASPSRRILRRSLSEGVGSPKASAGVGASIGRRLSVSKIAPAESIPAEPSGEGGLRADGSEGAAPRGKTSGGPPLGRRLWSKHFEIHASRASFKETEDERADTMHRSYFLLDEPISLEHATLRSIPDQLPRLSSHIIVCGSYDNLCAEGLGARAVSQRRPPF